MTLALSCSDRKVASSSIAKMVSWTGIITGIEGVARRAARQIATQNATEIVNQTPPMIKRVVIIPKYSIRGADFSGVPQKIDRMAYKSRSMAKKLAFPSCSNIWTALSQRIVCGIDGV